MLKWTRVVGVFTAVLAIVAGFQAWAFVQSERAFLSVQNFRFDGALTPDKQLVLAYAIVNSGRSTAIPHDVNVTLTTGLLDRPEYGDNVRFAIGPIAQSTEVPGFYFSQDGRGNPRIITADEVAKFMEGRTKFYVYGYVEYEDDFSLIGYRKTGFCYLFVPERSGGGKSAFRPCTEKQYTFVR